MTRPGSSPALIPPDGIARLRLAHRSELRSDVLRYLDSLDAGTALQVSRETWNQACRDCGSTDRIHDSKRWVDSQGRTWRGFRCPVCYNKLQMARGAKLRERKRIAKAIK